MTILEDLLQNFKEFLKSADRDLEDGLYNAAISSYFKAIAVLCDYLIYNERSLLPKNHKERFLFLELNYKEIYEIISPLFKEYTDSYNLRIKKEQAARLKENVERLRKILKIEK